MSIGTSYQQSTFVIVKDAGRIAAVGRGTYTTMSSDFGEFEEQHENLVFTLDEVTLPSTHPRWTFWQARIGESHTPNTLRWTHLATSPTGRTTSPTVPLIL